MVFTYTTTSAFEGILADGKLVLTNHLCLATLAQVRNKYGGITFMNGVKRLALVGLLASTLLAGCATESPSTPTSAPQSTAPAQTTTQVPTANPAPGGYVAPGAAPAGATSYPSP